MADEGFKRKLTAILSADVEGYSRLMGDDEEATVRTLTSYREVLTTLIQQHNGKVLDSPGDNLLAEFVSVVDAVQCAVAVQKEIKARNDQLPENRRMQFRIGINLGDVIQEDERIYGDGVNIAARLEGLSEPGGICISKTAFDHIESKLPYGYDFIGDQTVKNIAKPVGAYRVLMDPRVTFAGKSVDEKPAALRRMPILVGTVAILVLVVAAGIWQFYMRRPSVAPASIEKMAFPLPKKPSIAVLPFANMSKDPELGYLSDGFTETIIGALSRNPSLFVIARTSTFTYKKQPATIKQVAEELGVQYVIEGSIQKSEDKLRITVQMIDALKGDHVWSERYDRSIKDIFKIQDEITLKIVKSIAAKYDKVLAEYHVNVAGTNNLDAYLKELYGFHLMENLGPDNYRQLKRLGEEVIALDPNYMSAYYGQTSLLARGARYGLSESPEKSLEQMFKVAQKAVELDESSALAHAALGRAYYELKQHDKSISEFKEAIALDPNQINGYAIVWALCYAGRPQEAIPYVKKLERMSPRHPNLPWWFATPNIFMGKYEEALPYVQKAIDLGTKWFRVHLDLAACYAALGRKEEAKAAVQQVLKVHPNFSIKNFIMRLPVKDLEDIKYYVEALRKVPFPE